MDSQQIEGEWWTIPRNLFKNHRPHRVFLSAGIGPPGERNAESYPDSHRLDVRSG